jgi:N-acetylglucosaminyldiphosphoundecaprenol N-acetyl-beta-D-mannosaminyltransferase
MDQQTPLTSPFIDGLTSSFPLVLPPAQPEAPVSLPPAVPVPRPDSVDVWGTRFSILDMRQAIDLVDEVIQRRVPEYIITANLNYLMLTEQYPELRQINERAIAVLADGFPIVRRSRFSPTPLPERVAGADMIVDLARLSQARGYRLFFLGAAPGVAQAAAEKLQQQFPGMQLAGYYSPPFRTLNKAEHDEMLSRIRSAETDILLVALGQPKGELWISQNLMALNVPLSIQLGASFDFLAGTARRAPRAWRMFGCEWMYRACSDPRRLVPRYAANLAYLWRCIRRDLFVATRPNTAAAERGWS